MSHPQAQATPADAAPCSTEPGRPAADGINGGVAGTDWPLPPGPQRPAATGLAAAPTAADFIAAGQSLIEYVTLADDHANVGLWLRQHAQRLAVTAKNEHRAALLEANPAPVDYVTQDELAAVALRVLRGFAHTEVLAAEIKASSLDEMPNKHSRAFNNILCAAWWLGQANLLADLATGLGERCLNKDRRQSAEHDAPRSGCRAWAGLAIGLHQLTVAQAAQLYAAQGIQVTDDIVAKLQRGTAQQLKDEEIASIYASHEHIPALRALSDDFSNTFFAHSRSSLAQGGAA